MQVVAQTPHAAIRTSASPAWGGSSSTSSILTGCSASRRTAASYPHDGERTALQPYNRAVRAAVLHEIDRPLEVEEVDLAEPGPGQVAVRLAASGICHSDWNVITGATTNPLPVVPGHEGAAWSRRSAKA